jgi:hypothetical protein
MLDKLSRTENERCQNVDPKWDIAIIDAKKELAGVEQRASRLRNAIRIFQDNKAKGVQWPSGTD